MNKLSINNVFFVEGVINEQKGTSATAMEIDMENLKFERNKYCTM